VELLGTESRSGSVSAVGAVSPSGGDFSEPVTQNTLRITKVFWALSKSLAERRHFPAIDWLTSYSLYLNSIEEWYDQKTEHPRKPLRRDAMSLLQRDEELREIVMLVGPDALSEGQRATLEAARMIKEDFLIQSALHPVDSYCSPEKTTEMMRLILGFHKKMEEAVEAGVPLQRILDLPVRQEIARCKIEPSERFKEVAKRMETNLNDQFSKLSAEIHGVEAKQA
jgi:V/A-type H+-transporting ATPase subunit A